MNKVKLQIWRQINDHSGKCKGAENIYSEHFLFLTVDVPEEYKNCDVGTVILSHSWKKELSTLAPKINRGDTKDCYVGSGGKYDLNGHDYRLTVINAVIVKI
jgi:hypothetical protein